jgi:hypothetical protein
MNNRIIEQLKEVGITSYDDSLYPRIYVYGELGKESNTSTYFTINEGNSISIAGETDNTFIRLKELLDWDEWNQVFEQFTVINWDYSKQGDRVIIASSFYNPDFKFKVDFTDHSRVKVNGKEFSSLLGAGMYVYSEIDNRYLLGVDEKG